MAKTSEIYVHIWLEGCLRPVPCGLLIVTDDGRYSSSVFGYGRSYLERSNAIPLDPKFLPLTDQRFETKPDFDLFSAIRDAAPDGWGRHVLARLYGRMELTEAEYLCFSDPEDRFGALGMGIQPGTIGGFGSPADEKNDGHLKIRRDHDFLDIMKAVETFIEKDDFSKNPELRQYFIRGSSVGGARPKLAVRIKNEWWLAKFSRKDDLTPIPQIEYATMKLAKMIGLEVPEIHLVHLGAHAVYLIKRFDRMRVGKGFSRFHAISALTAIGAHERDYGRWGYEDIHNFMRQYAGHFTKDALELYRRMIFNIIVSNTDDHLRNHAFLYRNGAFHLSPLYDVCPNVQGASSIKNLYLKTDGDSREATLHNACNYGQRVVGLSQAEAQGIIDEMVQQTAQCFDQACEEAGLPQGLSESLRKQLTLSSNT